MREPRRSRATMRTRSSRNISPSTKRSSRNLKNGNSKRPDIMEPMTETSVPDSQEQPKLIRGVGTPGATALNMIDMIGVGPFITMPLIIAAMGGPQAMIGWILGAGLAICDGLVWAELGAAMPG